MTYADLRMTKGLLFLDFKFCNFLTFLASLLITGMVFSQTISYSTPQKLSAKTPDFQILGKNKEGIIIYKYGKDFHTIEAYGNNLSVKWEKSVSFKYQGAEVKRMVIYPEKTLIFYLLHQKGTYVLFAEKWNSKFAGDGNAVAIDTVDSGKFHADLTLRVATSQNQSKIVCYYRSGDDNAERLVMTICDDNLNIISRRTVTVNTGEESLLPRKVFPDNEGNVYVLLEDEKKSKKKGVGTDAFTVKVVEAATGDVKDIDFRFQRPVFRKLYLDYDNVNKRLVATGFYTDDVGEEAQGFFFTAFNTDSSTLKVNNYMKFSSDLIFEVTGKDTSKNSSGFYSFEVYDLIMRFDGGAVIIAESRFDTEENMQVPSFTPSMGPSFRTINITYYNDIMALSVNADGTVDWTKVLKKKQISEDDEGFFSSYCLATTSDRLHFIYNEEIYHKTNVSEYSVDKNGRVERKYLLNAGDRNVLLVPKLGKQISSTEIIIPSYKRNYLSFVKIAY